MANLLAFCVGESLRFSLAVLLSCKILCVSLELWPEWNNSRLYTRRRRNNSRCQSRAKDSFSHPESPISMKTLHRLFSCTRLRRILKYMRMSLQRVLIAEYLVRPACGSDMRISGAADIFCGLVNPIQVQWALGTWRKKHHWHPSSQPWRLLSLSSTNIQNLILNLSHDNYQSQLKRYELL